MRVIEKPWGKEEIIEENPAYTVKRLTMNPGQSCSLQYHRHKLETIYILKGLLVIDVEGRTFALAEGKSITIKAGAAHRMSAIQSEAIYLESSTTYPEDVVRLEDKYGRA